MAAPLFFADALPAAGDSMELPEESSRHIVQVLRMAAGEQLHLTDGRGKRASCRILSPHKKHCLVECLDLFQSEVPASPLTIGISLLKHPARFEWFLEKATECGVRRIVPMICARTEKQQGRVDRFRQICLSAMLQSGQLWLPELEDPQPFDKVLVSGGHLQKYMAYCGEEPLPALPRCYTPGPGGTIVLIGPEGDFTAAEVAEAVAAGFRGVSLGATRLRSETAGVVAAALCRSYV